MLPVVFALCSGSNPSSRSDGDGRSWDGAGLGLFSPRLGRVEFWAGAVGGKGHGGPKFLGRCRGGARAIAAVKSLLLKFWDQIPTGIQIPGGDSSPLGVSCLRWVFPVSSGLGLVLFWTMEVFGAPKHHPTLRLGSCPIPGAFGIPVPFFLQFHGVWRPLVSPPQHNSVFIPLLAAHREHKSHKSHPQ